MQPPATPAGETAPDPGCRYPLATCIVSGKRLDATATTFIAGDRAFAVCSAECKTTIEQDIELWARQVDAANISEQLLNYPLATCVVSGKALGEHATTVMHGSTLLRTCCTGCKEALQKDPVSALSKLATASSASFGNADLDCAAWTKEQTNDYLVEQAVDYPLTTCPVSGKPVSTGNSTDLLLDGTLIRLCCEHCIDKATKNAATIVTTIQRTAFVAQKSSYPLTTCVVSGKPLGEHAASTMIGLTLVRTCSPDCNQDLGKCRTTVVGTIRNARATADTAATAPCCGTADAAAVQTSVDPLR